MRSDPDHVLDAIDGVVEDWETLSADAMRWAPPEEKPGTPPDILREVSETFGPLAASFVQALRPLGEAVLRPLTDFLDSQLFNEPPSEGLWEVEEATTSCQCLCFRHPDRPDICTGAAESGAVMCAACAAHSEYGRPT
ncbi:hypothetical protein [Nonomuraea dietziae]|uniref:hypothetical protein n=1 Tax=Nonomuraea dietziae TaxID=65515 RepID=UPI0033C939B3